MAEYLTQADMEEVLDQVRAEAAALRADNLDLVEKLAGEGHRVERLLAENAALKERLSCKIVCLCGSTRFKLAFEQANRIETLAGKIVLSVGFFPHWDREHVAPVVKEALDQLHLRKIDLADEVLVLNVDGYVGDSTLREIEYAHQHQKPIRWWDKARALLDPQAAEPPKRKGSWLPVAEDGDADA